MVRDGVLLLVLERSSDKALEQGMCAVGAALEFGVELYAHMEITAGQLNSFHQAAIRAGKYADSLIAVAVPRAKAQGAFKSHGLLAV